MQHIPTPFLQIDESTVRRNVARLARYAQQHGLGIRPHTKTHKSLHMAAIQLEAGARGLTVAKVGEAEVMVDACDDLLIAYPAVDESRVTRIAKLALEATVRVAVDSRMSIEALAAAARKEGSIVGILVDLDLGYHRTGVASPQAATELAELVMTQQGLHLDGLFCYPGHVRGSAAAQAAPLGEVAEVLHQTLEVWRRKGLNAAIVSGGSTPTAYQSHLAGPLTEIRPGTYIYNDMNTVRGGFADLADCAARVICTVISDAVTGKVVIDAGSKTLAADPNAILPDSGFGHVMEFPKAKITRLTEEHGEVDVSACELRPKLGQRLSVIPNHICPCVNLHDAAWLLRETGHTERLPVDARGRVS